jgi:hypothetical protein
MANERAIKQHAHDNGNAADQPIAPILPGHTMIGIFRRNQGPSEQKPVPQSRAVGRLYIYRERCYVPDRMLLLPLRLVKLNL